jgi:hypothetical protein
LCEEANSSSYARRTAPVALKALRNLSLVLTAISVKDIVRAQLRTSTTFSASHPAANARISSRKAPARAIPAIATDSGAPRSSPVATSTPVTNEAHEPNAKIIAAEAAENVSTAVAVTPVGRFMCRASQFTHDCQDDQNQ